MMSKKKNKTKCDGMLVATFLTTLFYSATYPFIWKRILSDPHMTESLVALQQIISCLSIIVFSYIWNKKTDKLFKYYREFCVAEMLTTTAITIYCLSTDNIVGYYILDSIACALVTRQIICGGIKLRANRYKTENKRVNFDNKNNMYGSAATIIGSLLAMILKLDFRVMLIIATIGNAIDNIFYIVIYTNQVKRNKESDD